MTVAWVLTDGKAGDEAQCLGVTEALGLEAEVRRVRPRAAFGLLAPWGPMDPSESPGQPGSPIGPPFPDLVVASGRRIVPYVRVLRRRGGPRTFTVILKDPRTGPGAADLIWVPEHDRLRGANVISTLTGPHRISPARLAAARLTPNSRIAACPRPRVAVLIGGDSRHHRFTSADIERFAGLLAALTAEGASLLPVVSRRTPERVATALRAVAPRAFADGEAGMPYLDVLALADAIVVTADSTNMVGEAVATGAPVLLFEPSGGHPKVRAYLDALARRGAVRPFAGRLEAFTYEPLDSTLEIAGAVRDGLERHRAALARAG